MFNLEKGGSFTLDKANSKYTIGLGWDVADNGTHDLDAHVFGCVDGPKFYNNASHAVTYANKPNLKVNGPAFGSKDDSIISKGDNLTGAGDGADEEIVIDTSKLPAEIKELLVFLTIHNAAKNKQHFGQVKNSFCSITDESGKEVCRYNLKDMFNGCVSIQVGSLVKDANGAWVFTAMGAGLQTEELGDILKMLS